MKPGRRGKASGWSVSGSAPVVGRLTLQPAFGRRPRGHRPQDGRPTLVSRSTKKLAPFTDGVRRPGWNKHKHPHPQLGRRASFRTGMFGQMACADQVAISTNTLTRSLAGTQVPSSAVRPARKCRLLQGLFRNRVGQIDGRGKAGVPRLVPSHEQTQGQTRRDGREDGGRHPLEALRPASQVGAGLSPHLTPAGP